MNVTPSGGKTVTIPLPPAQPAPAKK
jgi:hypothetical protein